MKSGHKDNTALIAIIGSIILAVILVTSTIWMGHAARQDTNDAVRSVSLLYLDELAGRREQVVEDNLNEKIHTITTAIEFMDDYDSSSKEHLENFQYRLKQLYHLQRFAFIDTDGLIYTSTGYEHDPDKYGFDYRTLKEPEVDVINVDAPDKDNQVIIAVPVDVTFQNKKLSVCFMAIGMDDMLAGVSLNTNTNDATFCNIYTNTGKALTNTVLGGLASEDNLLDAMKAAQFEDEYSYETFTGEFQSGTRGVVSFTYGGTQETLAYIPISGTDCLLTYLIRESVISDSISSISDGAVKRSIMQSVLTVLAMLVMFAFLFSQTKKNSRLMLEQETKDAEARIKQEELEHRLELQDKLIEEEQQNRQQRNMIAALSSDYFSVYYLELDKNEGICYQQHSDLDGTGFKVGDQFKYMESVTAYAKQYITDDCIDEFMEFIQPENIREGLKDHNVISHTYKVTRHGHDTYEQVRFAAVRNPGERSDEVVQNVSACFVDVDEETRKSLAQTQALSDALSVAEDANKAKTAFLSNMSHEIRTPMNAIISLNNIAINDPETSDKAREYLTKIESSAEHLMHLINDILDMSRIESGHLVIKNEEFYFPKLLSSINTMFSSQCEDNGLDYQCHIKSDIDDYYIGDSMKLRQVLINILGNAVKFTPEGGSVSLDVERKAQFDGKSTLCFTISDTGIGMSEEFLPHIFDTFAQEDTSTTSKYGSSGLGLAITNSIVHMMNGDIEVRSKKGEGSTFIVTVTLNDSTRTDKDECNDEIHPDELAVLIVDDDPVACEHAKLVLEEIGISSEIATSGQEALDMVTLRHARREPYNLILVDWQMPEMDGIETTRKIREVVGHESAIVILTAYSWDDILEEAIHAGVDSFIPKPLFATTVMEEFQAAMKRKNEEAKKEESHKADLNGRRILLAEDTQVNAEIMKMLLGTRNMEVDLAVNGRIAVDKFSSNPEGFYDAILMDVRMPEMDGLEATRTIRAMDRPDAGTLPIIALTANAFDEDVQRSLQAGLNAHLSKPVNPEALFETLETLIKD